MRDDSRNGTFLPGSSPTKHQYCFGSCADMRTSNARPYNFYFLFEVFWSEEEEKTIKYRFFDDVTKTRRVSRRVYRADDNRLCFRKIEPFFQKRFCIVTLSNSNLSFFVVDVKRQSLSDCLVCYSVLSASTGSFFAALLEGIIPAMRVRRTLIATRIMAISMGRIARRLPIPVAD